jgi:hypothetical protein
MAHRAKTSLEPGLFDEAAARTSNPNGTTDKSPSLTKSGKAAKPGKSIKLVKTAKDNIAQNDLLKSQAKPGYTRLQVYVTRAEVNAALQREAQARKMSLSQAASAMIERGLRGRIEPDADNRLLNLERRLSDHMRTSSRDLMIIEEMIFSTLKVLMTRFPHDVSLEDPTYQAAIDAKMSGILDDVARRIGSHNVVRAQEPEARAEAEKKATGKETKPNTSLEGPLPAVANDSAASTPTLSIASNVALPPSKPIPAKTTAPTTLEMDF